MDFLYFYGAISDLPGMIHKLQLKPGDELVMEQIDDVTTYVNDVNHQNMICHIQSCPTVLRKTVADLFPNHTVEDHSVLSVITITLKPNIKRMRTNKELETEKIAQTVCRSLS
ncbi:hypothetical protein NQ315_016782 [Exocentrus adspersus]|uniref:Gamma-glutamylcyclotransferase AIG2-like domain-containing protein n=1 Tax=Exocentrus adspersus TaxID=1586481 RepID=A0AAV8V5B6_9CUCU|nr:hypothetical protein NQ315_016782 [Exocentrus adspersus]